MELDEENKNKPAFGHGNYNQGGASGLTKREWLYGKVLNGLCSNPKILEATQEKGQEYEETIVEWANYIVKKVESHTTEG